MLKAIQLIVATTWEVHVSINWWTDSQNTLYPNSSSTVSCSVVFNSLQPHGLQPTRLFCPWVSPGKNIGVACHSLTPGDLPDPGIKPGSPALQADSLPFELQGTPSSYIQIVECYAETKRNRLLTPSTTPSTTQMDLRNIMLSERRQLFYDFIYMKYPEGASLQRQKANQWLPGGGDGNVD